MYLSIISVKPLSDYKLLLKFENDEERIFDVSEYLDLGKFKELKDEALFNSVKVSFDTIQWGNELDFDPEFLYKESRLLNVG